MNIGYVYSIYKVCCIMSVSKALHSFNFQNFPFFYKLKTNLTYTCITKFCISLRFVCAIVCAFVCAFVYVIRLHCHHDFRRLILNNVKSLISLSLGLLSTVPCYFVILLSHMKFFSETKVDGDKNPTFTYECKF